MRCDKCHNVAEEHLKIKLPRGYVLTLCEDCGVQFSGAVLAALETLTPASLEAEGQRLYLQARHELIEGEGTQ